MPETTRDAYVQKMKGQLDRWNAEIDRLQAKAKEAGSEAQKEFHERVAELRSRREGAEEKLEELRSSTSGAWEDLKTGVELAWESLGEAVKSATKRLGG